MSAKNHNRDERLFWLQQFREAIAAYGRKYGINPRKEFPFIGADPQEHQDHSVEDLLAYMAWQGPDTLEQLDRFLQERIGRGLAPDDFLLFPEVNIH